VVKEYPRARPRNARRIVTTIAKLGKQGGEGASMSKIYDELRSAEQLRRASHVPAGVRIVGEISGSEDLTADGSIEGPVKLSNGILSVGESGSVKGNVAAKEVIVHGTVTGNVEADRVEIKPSGTILGDIVTSRIIINDGARCTGMVDVGEKRTG